MPYVLEGSGISSQVGSIVLMQLSQGGNNFDSSSNLNLVVASWNGSGDAYAIPDKEFEYLKFILPAVAAVFADKVEKWAPASIAGLLLLLVQFWRKRIHLNPGQATILRELKAAPGLSVSDLVDLIDLPTFTLDRVSHLLLELTEMKDEAGSLVELAEHDSQGKWYPKSV